MKNNSGASCYLLLPVMVVLLFLIGCKNDKVPLPQLITTSISDITVNSSTGGGKIMFDGGETISTCGLCWGLNHNPAIDKNKTSDTLQNSIFISHLKNLVSDTVYYVRAYASNNGGVIYGNEVSFRTLKKTLSVVTTNQPLEITSGSFKIEGEIMSNGDGVISACGFCWSLKENPTVDGDKNSSISTGNKFAVVLDGLIPQTTYYVRAYATNEKGTAYGNQVVVTSLPVAVLSELAVVKVSVFSLTVSTGITSDYGTTITERGFCWGTTDKPTVDNSFASSGNGLGAYSYKIDQLSSSSVYYIRGYARNKYGIIYGATTSSKTMDQTGTLLDISGNTYKYITIGEQTWMAADLKTGKYRNGDDIISYVSSASTVGTAGTYYSNPDYGKFYNWYAVNDPRNIAPAGWHVATDDEWTQLETFIGGSSVAGGKLKESQTYWYQPNAASDLYGFKALPTGYRYIDGTYAVGGYLLGYWWTATEATQKEAYQRILYYRDTQSLRNTADKRIGQAVRCVRD